MNPQWPVYIVSKGRADTRYTARALELLGVPFYIVVEAQEREAYAAVIRGGEVLVLPPEYQQRYDTCDALPDDKSKGPGPARNFAWDHAVALGAAWHWVMDDNIRWWARMNASRKIKVASGTIFRCMEDFCSRYRNIAMAGPNYESLIARKQQAPPFVLNTRIYSCNLIRNDVPFRWRGRYNEDTDLSLRMLKAHWCTVQFNAFLQKKIRTQLVQGGNTTDFYAKEGTLPKSRMLVQLHPDVARMVFKYGRVHHQVDYRRFVQPLVLREGIQVQDCTNDYGMTTVEYERPKTETDLPQARQRQPRKAPAQRGRTQAEG